MNSCFSRLFFPRRIFLALAALAALVTLVAFGALAAFAGRPAFAVGGERVEEYKFSVLMNGSRIGTHDVIVSHTDTETNVAIDVELDVGIGPFTLYSYFQKNRAVWRDGELAAFRSETDDDGDEFTVEAKRSPGAGMSVAINGAAPIERPVWFPTTYWNKATIEQSQLLSTQDGEIKEIAVSPIGTQEITVRQKPVMAQKYELRGDLDIDLWYDENDKWVRLAFSFRGNDFVYDLR